MTMLSDDRGMLPMVAAVGVLLLVIGGVAVAGLAVGQQSPDGEAVLEAVEQRYDDADSVVAEGTVTVQNASERATYDVTLAATDEDQARVTVAGAEGRIVAGHTGTEYWVYDPQTDTTTIVTPGDEEEAPTVEVRAGPDADAPAPASGDLGQVARTLQSGDGSFDAMPTDREFDAEEVTAEVIDTRTLDGTQTYVLAISAPETEGSARLWVDTQSSEILRAEATHDEWTMTIDVRETRFDVSAADSTFEPPNADGTDISPRSVDSLATLEELSSLPVADPGDAWTFETGSVVSAPLTAVTAEYTADGTRIVVAQTSTDRLPEAVGSAGESLTIGDRSVTIVEHEQGRVVWWQSDGVLTSVSGDLSRSELEAVVAETSVEDDG